MAFEQAGAAPRFHTFPQSTPHARITEIHNKRKQDTFDINNEGGNQPPMTMTLTGPKTRVMHRSSNSKKKKKKKKKKPNTYPRTLRRVNESLVINQVSDATCCTSSASICLIEACRSTEGSENSLCPYPPPASGLCTKIM
jgi:hypothetical protein